MKTCGEQRDMHSSLILDIGTRWKWIVSLTHWMLYSRVNSCQYPLIEGWFGFRAILNAMEKTEITVPSGNRIPVVQTVKRGYTTLTCPICFTLLFLLTH
jgi:hypothetical protein